MKISKNYKIIIVVLIVLGILLVTSMYKKEMSGDHYVTEQEAQDWCDNRIRWGQAESCNMYYNAYANRWCIVYPVSRDATDCSPSNPQNYQLMYVWPSDVTPTLETYTCLRGNIYKDTFMGPCAQIGTNYVNECKKDSGAYLNLDSARAGLCVDAGFTGNDDPVADDPITPSVTEPASDEPTPSTTHCLALLQTARDDGTCGLSMLSIGLIAFFMVMIGLKFMQKDGGSRR
jgi:hypothetical protein